MSLNDIFFSIVYEFKRKIRYLLLKKHDLSLVTNNCIGGKLAHDFGLRLNSPTVNLQMTPEDFVKFCYHLDVYLSMELQEVKQVDKVCSDKFKNVGGDEISFPVAKLGDIHLFLQHYDTFESAVECWKRRVSRLNKSNCYFILVTKYEGHIKAVNDFLVLPKKINYYL